MLEGKNVIITGSNRGIGNAIVKTFAKQGANIWACARQYNSQFEEEMESLALECNTKIQPIYFDLNKSEEIRAAVKEIRKEKKPINTLVTAAGVNSEYRRFQMITMDNYKHLLQSNFLGHLELTQLISRMMIQQRNGSIIHLSSIAGTDGFFASCDYVASKAAIMGATVQQARELGMFGIRVNHIAPGITETEMLNQGKKEMLNSIIPAIMLGRFAKPQEIANAALFLASDLSTYITAQEIRVDGGCNPPRANW